MATLKPVPKTQRSKRALEQRGPKLVENVKRALFLKGPKVSQVVTSLLKDLYILKKPHAKMFTKKNITRPFEDQSSMEFLCERNDTSLFAYGAHSKKRPHNIVLGRMFDFQLLDMIELGVVGATYKPVSAFSSRKATVRLGGKPLIIFQGELFESNSDLQMFKSLMLDFYRGEVLEKINLASLDRLIVITAAHTNKIFFRQYAIMMKKSGTKFPRIEVEEIGPHVDWEVRRVKHASSELHKQSMKQARAGVKRKKKNIEEGVLGEKLGRVHLEKQDLQQMALKKMKGLKKRRVGAVQGTDGTAADEAESAAEVSAVDNIEGDETAAEAGEVEGQ